jgi:hypothetical protein
VDSVVVAQGRAQRERGVGIIYMRYAPSASIEGKTFLDLKKKLLFGLVTDDLSHENYVT